MLQKVKNSYFRICCFVIFIMSSCTYFETKKISSETFLEEELKSINWKDVDQYPVFTNCEDISDKLTQKSCFESTLTTQIYQFINSKNIIANRDLNDTVNLDFLVTNTALISVTNIEMDSLLGAAFPQLEKWLLESIDSISVVAPAYKRGIPVNTEFSLPIVIKTQGL